MLKSLTNNQTIMLKNLRKIIAAIFFIGLLLLFIIQFKSSEEWLGWMAKIQFVPALMSLNFIIIAAIAIVTLLFGRIYCSMVCPLGIFQDILSSVFKKKKRFHYTKGYPVVRYAFLIAFLAFVALGLASLIAIIDPYSIFGRWTAVGTASGLAFNLVAIVTFIIICVFGIFFGRSYCNNICPVGTILGLLSKYSLFRFNINTDKCNGCKVCAMKCKGKCINPEEHKVDMDRCVGCFNCIGNCKQGAISYSLRGMKMAEPTDNSRRTFVGIVGLLTSSLLFAKAKNVSEAVASLDGKTTPKRRTPLKPAGAQSLNIFSKHCTGCQLCVNHCPQHVLKPSADLTSFMQVEMSYEDGYCDIDCNKCSQVCPTGAISPITLEEKNATQIGHAVAYPDYCINNASTGSCGKCEEVCPAGAITLIEKDGKMVPSIDEEFCIGCGACEFNCKASPVKAIIVEGHEVHKEV